MYKSCGAWPKLVGSGVERVRSPSSEATVGIRPHLALGAEEIAGHKELLTRIFFDASGKRYVRKDPFTAGRNWTLAFLKMKPANGLPVVSN